MSSVIQVRGLRKTYIIRVGPPLRKKRLEVKALDGVSFDVKRKEIFGLLGPNGAGKSTTINIISGLIYADSGDVELLGRQMPSQKSEIANRVNVAAAYSQLHGRLTVYENLKIFGMLYGITGQKLERRIRELLRFFEIEDLKDKRIWLLSTGQRTRVNLSKGLINEPEVLLLDEVTLGLDPHIALATRRLIKSLPRATGATILLTSNNMADIEICGRAAFLNRGVILKTGTPAALKRLVKKEKRTLDEAFIEIMREEARR